MTRFGSHALLAVLVFGAMAGLSFSDEGSPTKPESSNAAHHVLVELFSSQN